MKNKMKNMSAAKFMKIWKVLFSFLLIPFFLLLPASARAYEFQDGKNTFRLTAEGSAGAFGGGSFSDFLLRLQASRMMPNRWNAGAVYALDKRALDAKYAAKDAFLYVETEWGRVEAGWTESIAAKLALVLPDVGGTRLNNAPFFLADDFSGITNPAVYGNQYAWRLNMATIPTLPVQFGMGRTVFSPNGFNSSFDAGLRYRNPDGRTKSSASLGFSYVDRPRGFAGDAYLPPATARARYQGTIGLNLQFGALIWAATGKIIIDDRPTTEIRSDGLQAGTGFSYDFLSWSASANYIFSSVGVWSAMENIEAHTGIVSARYKINKNFNIWGSAGGVWSDAMKTNYFASAGLGVKF